MTVRKKLYYVTTIEEKIVTTTRVYRVPAYTEGEAADNWRDDNDCTLDSTEVDNKESLEEDIDDISEYSDM